MIAATMTTGPMITQRRGVCEAFRRFSGCPQFGQAVAASDRLPLHAGHSINLVLVMTMTAGQRLGAPAHSVFKLILALCDLSATRNTEPDEERRYDD